MRSKYPKILLLAGWYPHSLDASDGDFIFRQARLMIHEGINLNVFHSSLSYKYLLNGQVCPKKTITHIGGNTETVIESPFWPRNTKWTFKRWISRYVNDTLSYIDESGRPDLIHAHCYLGGIVAQKVNEILGIPYIITLHETSFLSRIIPSYHLPHIHKAFDHADSIVCVSRALGKVVEDMFHAKSITVPNFIDPAVFIPSQNKNTTFTFVFIGELIERKNVKMLLDAFHIIVQKRDVRLVFIGAGPQKKMLEEETKINQSERMVDFEGRLTESEVAIILSKSHCLVLPSHAETFGIVLIESLMCGVPVISTPSGGPGDIIITPETGILMNAFERDELADCMLKMVDDHIKYDPQKLRKYALDNFSASVISERYSHLYQEILNQSKH